MQLSLPLDAAPDGLVYLPDFVAGDEAAALTAACEAVEYHAVVMHGTAARRTVARIGWHRDAPMFGPTVAGLSLGAPCTLELRRRRAGGFETWALAVAPRSLYVLGGAARKRWQHMIPPVPGLRYSLTFRTLAPNSRARAPSAAERRR